MTTEFNYKAPSAGNRYLILSDLEQEYPEGPLKVTGIEERTSAAGTKFPVLKLEAEDGTDYEASAWERDVKPCLHEYGTNPLKWGRVRFQRGAKRYVIVPVDDVKVQNVG